MKFTRHMKILAVAVVAIVVLSLCLVTLPSSAIRLRVETIVYIEIYIDRKLVDGPVGFGEYAYTYSVKPGSHLVEITHHNATLWEKTTFLLPFQTVKLSASDIGAY